MKYIGISTVVVGVAVVVFALSIGADREVRPVRVGFLNIAASLPLFIAQENGFFADEGIEIRTYPIATSNQLVDGILADNLDIFVESSAVPVLAAALRLPGTIKIFAVSSITSDKPFDRILVRAEASLSSLEDLEGTSIGVFPGSTAANLLRRFLQDSDIDVGSISFVPVPPQTQVAALLQGSLAAVHAYEPTTAIALQNGEARVLHGSVYAEMLEPNPQGVAVVSSQFASDSPERAASAIRALERAMDFMRENDAGSRTILSNRLNLSKEVADAMVFLYMVGHEEISVTTLQRYADMLTELGELPEETNVAELIYTSN